MVDQKIEELLPQEDKMIESFIPTSVTQDDEHATTASVISSDQIVTADQQEAAISETHVNFFLRIKTDLQKVFKFRKSCLLIN